MFSNIFPGSQRPRLLGKGAVRCVPVAASLRKEPPLWFPSAIPAFRSKNRTSMLGKHGILIPYCHADCSRTLEMFLERGQSTSPCASNQKLTEPCILMALTGICLQGELHEMGNVSIARFADAHPKTTRKSSQRPGGKFEKRARNSTRPLSCCHLNSIQIAIHKRL